MNIYGIIAEFNPFHSGHAYLIAKAREKGATHIVCVMSGNFVQRGDVAVCSKKARAEMALRSGADLIIELPVTFATATAQKFAFGSVATLDALGCIGSIAFGSECGDTAALTGVADALCDDNVKRRTREILQSGITFAAARQQALCELGFKGELLRNPNDTLAISYIEAISTLNASIAPVAIKRIGVAHDGGVSDRFASASHLRQLMENSEDISKYVPSSTLEIISRETLLGRAPMSISRLEGAILARLRTMSLDEIAALPDISEGLENRLYKAIYQQSSVFDIINSVKSKRYTHARIRRIVLSALLGINKAASDIAPQYIRILGINERGREILSAASPTLPIIARAKDAEQLPSSSKALIRLEQQADNLALLALKSVKPCESTLSQTVIL